MNIHGTTSGRKIAEAALITTDYVVLEENEFGTPEIIGLNISIFTPMEQVVYQKQTLRTHLIY